MHPPRLGDRRGGLRATGFMFLLSAGAQELQILKKLAQNNG